MWSLVLGGAVASLQHSLKFSGPPLTCARTHTDRHTDKYVGHVRLCNVCMYVCIYVCMYVCMYVCVCVCVCVCVIVYVKVIEIDTKGTEMSHPYTVLIHWHGNYWVTFT
jgi:hypothetical protein